MCPKLLSKADRWVQLIQPTGAVLYCPSADLLMFVGCLSQVSVSLLSSGLRVCVKDGAEEKTLMEGEFTHKINTENSLWSLEPGKCVLVRVYNHEVVHSI